MSYIPAANIAPQEFGTDIVQFVIERSVLGTVASCMPMLVWVSRIAEPRGALSACLNCAEVHAVTPESETFMDSFNPQSAAQRERFRSAVGYGGRFYICPCMGRFIE